jgi:hypothetical protein
MFRQRSDPTFPNRENVASTFEAMLDQAEANQSVHYHLNNFQMRHFGVTLAEALRVLQNETFWFGLTEFPAMSYALLQCQVFASVSPEAMRMVSSTHQNLAPPDAFGHYLSSKTIQRLIALNREELLFFSLATMEFWNRAQKHTDCIEKTGLLNDFSLIRTRNAL